MKPSMNPKTLQVALVIVGTVLAAVAEAPGIEDVIPHLWVRVLSAVGIALGSSQLFKRLADYAPSEVTLVPAERKSEV